jgi:hypothetical protein
MSNTRVLDGSTKVTVIVRLDLLELVMNDEPNYHNIYCIYVVNEVDVSWFLRYSDANKKLMVSNVPLRFPRKWRPVTSVHRYSHMRCTTHPVYLLILMKRKAKRLGGSMELGTVCCIIPSTQRRMFHSVN